MSGKFYFLDTNTIIQLLKGNQNLVELLETADSIICSIISKLEYLSFPNLSNNDIELFDKFAKKIEVMDLPANNYKLHQYILDIRRDRKHTLVTADQQILVIDELDVLSYNVL